MNQQCAGVVLALRRSLLHLRVHWVHLGDVTKQHHGLARGARELTLDSTGVQTVSQYIHTLGKVFEKCPWSVHSALARGLLLQKEGIFRKRRLTQETQHTIIAKDKSIMSWTPWIHLYATLKTFETIAIWHRFLYEKPRSYRSLACCVFSISGSLHRTNITLLSHTNKAWVDSHTGETSELFPSDPGYKRCAWFALPAWLPFSCGVYPGRSRLWQCPALLRSPRRLGVWQQRAARARGDRFIKWVRFHSLTFALGIPCLQRLLRLLGWMSRSGRHRARGSAPGPARAGEARLHGDIASRDVALPVCTSPSGLERESCWFWRLCPATRAPYGILSCLCWKAIKIWN